VHFYKFPETIHYGALKSNLSRFFYIQTGRYENLDSNFNHYWSMLMSHFESLFINSIYKGTNV